MSPEPLQNIRVHHLHWDGPFDVEEAINTEKKWCRYPGIYQIYGTHPVMGKGCLLYIGKHEYSLSSRIKEHQGWLDKEYDAVQIYFGRLVDEEKNIRTDEFEYLPEGEPLYKYLSAVEALLIFSASPPYNSVNIQTPNTQWVKEQSGSGGNPVLVYNTGFFGTLPQEVSTLWHDRCFPLDGAGRNIPST